jgi:hypothetical protein
MNYIPQCSGVMTPCSLVCGQKCVRRVYINTNLTNITFCPTPVTISSWNLFEVGQFLHCSLYGDLWSMQNLTVILICMGARGSVVGWGTMLQAERSPVRVSYEVEFFSLPNPSSRTMALGSTQPLTEMSTRNLPGGKKRPARRADNLAAISEPNVWKCGSLNLSQP